MSDNRKSGLVGGKEGGGGALYRVPAPLHHAESIKHQVLHVKHFMLSA